MAKILPSDPNYHPGKSRGRIEVYPWDEWFDGNWREFYEGVDFHNIIASNFIQTAYKAARRRGLRIVTTVKDDDTCAFRAIV